MKVKFFCDSGANIRSCRSDTLDTVADLGLEPGEWKSLSEDAKYEIVREWAEDHLEIFWEDVE